MKVLQTSYKLAHLVVVARQAQRSQRWHEIEEETTLTVPLKTIVKYFKNALSRTEREGTGCFQKVQKKKSGSRK